MIDTMKAPSQKKNSRTSPKQNSDSGMEARVRRILVPTDFSAYSKYALSYAASLASQFHAELLLLYVVEPTVYPADLGFGQLNVSDLERDLQQRAIKELNDTAERYSKSGPAVRSMVKKGKPFLEIVETAKSENIDLIIIATHGHTGMEHLLFGSTTEKVIRKAPCSVLVVRK